MRAAAAEYKWNLNYGGIALMWRGGCIIRSAFLGKIKEAFDNDPNLTNLLLTPFFKDAVEKAQASWRRVVTSAVEMGIPVPAISTALAYYDGYRHDTPAGQSPAGPTRLLRRPHVRARRQSRGATFFHTNWTGRGGDTAASTYIV